ncbi:helix-turn-helix domain-containing protein [Nocardioides sp. S-58]|uniref:Helix-turn-helix domain-containing protein n=1 Tax=Nocardioides renjunii TaxID=3095075 RepID=A0ABU5K832_9ACTN|nr:MULTISPECIES: helix-turn-helix domain-containing protein [unclassified Nocardioides]MDZ5661122.1 helix-turn-helix domain-containing protein [Nocardioides sp. S-58]WQQ22123.1 helix-turn-helix domain-containing protein [Nocardioides sp. S-34]
MSTRPVRPATQLQTVVGLDPEVADALRERLAEVADSAVLRIVEEVPSYAGAWSGRMGAVIRNAVQLALGGFLTLATRQDADAPKAPAIEGAYQLGRGEARSGRTVEALLSAYRIGARASWRDMADVAVEAGVDAGQLARFAELVFAYIDELSAASVAGHTDELESSGRVRQRNLERLARALLTGAPADAVNAAAERADWEPPGALTAVVLAESQMSAALTALDPRTLQPTDDVPGLPEGHASLLVPGTGSAAARPALLRALQGTDAVVGPSVPWLEASASYRRALRCAALGLEGLVDSDEHLAALLLAADPDARADLRARVLAPLAELRPSTAEKLTDTLRSWLLHHGRREAVAEELFVHAQTVRYRVGQLREVYGDRLEDPAFVLDATLALA